MNILNICKDFSVNVAGLPIPKHAIFGKVGRTYWYIDDFKQFSQDYKIVDIYIMTPQDKHFKKCLAKRDNFFIQKLESFIHAKKLENTVCIYPLKMGKKSADKITGLIAAKQSQADFLFRPSNQDTKHAITDYACGKMPRWVNYK